MTKLLQWLCGVCLYLSVWLGVLTQHIPVQLSDTANSAVLLSPVLLVIAFGCYSLALIGYRVATFNDCSEAEVELKQEIKEARKDLQKKGFKFD